jgi:hypothetical protein
MKYIVVLVTSCFRYLASAPKVHWQAGAEAPALQRRPSSRGYCVLPLASCESMFVY